MMKRSRRNSLFLRTMALIMTIGLLFGAIPVAAVETDVQVEEESVAPATEEIPAAEETVVSEPEEKPETKDSDNKGDLNSEIDEEESGAKLIESKDDVDLAEIAEAPSGVKIEVEEGEYESYLDYYYTGIKNIKISYTKPEDLASNQVKVIFDQDVSETEDYDAVAWWDDYANLSSYIDRDIEGNSVKLTLHIEDYVTFKYNSDGFSEDSAGDDGVYTLVFPYDVDGDGKPVLYSQNFMITNKKPKLEPEYLTVKYANQWLYKDATVKYEFPADATVTGIKKVQLLQNDFIYSTSAYSSDTLIISESGHYYLEVTDILKVSNKIDLGEFKIDEEPPKIGDSFTYESAKPGSEEWASPKDGPVKVYFNMTTGDSGIKKKKYTYVDQDGNPVGSSSEVKKSDNAENKDEYYVEFSEPKDIEVKLTNGAGVVTRRIIPAPQIDKEAPDSTSINHIGFSSVEENKIIQLLTFGIYHNKKLKMTVYTEDESPITKIEVVDSEGEPVSDKKIVPGSETADGNLFSKSFTINPGETPEDPGDFSDISFRLTDAAGNVSEKKISWEDIERYTVEDKSGKQVTELLNNEKKVKEMVDTKLTADVSSFEISGEKSDQNPGYYRNNIEITAEVNESLTGIESATAYFGTSKDFEFEEESNKYTPKDSALVFKHNDTENKKFTISDKDGEKIKAYQFDYKIDDDDLPTGKYIICIKALNNAGNEMQISKVFYIDKKAPVIEVDPVEKWSPDNKITFSVTDMPADNNVGVGQVAIKGDKDTPLTVFTDADKNEDGKYVFADVKKGENYTITAKDLLNNEAEPVVLDYYKDIKFDNLPPQISDFTYLNKDGKEMTEDQWSSEVTVEFTINDMIDGKKFSGFDVDDPNTFVIKRKGPDGETLDIKVSATPTKEDSDNTYECTFKVPEDDNFTEYSVTVLDRAKNATTKEIEKPIHKDSIAPVIEKIIISGFKTKLDNSLYGEDSLKATVYTKTGHSAPVADILLYNGETKLETTEEYKEVTKIEGDYYVRSFVLKGTDDGSLYKTLKVKAESAAGVLAEKGIESLNIYADGVDEKFEPFLEAVAKLTGPSIELDNWKFPKEEENDANQLISGYVYDINGNFTGDYGTYQFKVLDQIAGVNEGSINVYFDKKDKFKLNSDNVFVPDKDPRKLNDIGKTSTEDNEIKGKNISTDCEYQGTAETAVKANEGGEYVLCVQADNLSGVTKTASKLFYVDNDAPVIDNIKYDGSAYIQNNWSSKEVKVTFDVNDLPGINGGIKDVTVIGVTDGETYKAERTDENSSEYYFITGIAQKYIITAWDHFNIKTQVTTERVLTDMYDPHVTIPNLHDYQTNWKPETRIIEFNVDDLFEHEKFSGSDKELSGIKSIVIEDEDGNREYDVTPALETDYPYTSTQRTFQFEAKKYGDYSIIVTDAAGREIKNTDLQNIAIDNDDPYFTEISFSSHQSTGDKILNFLTFGLYAGSAIDMTVKARDNYPSSRISDITIEGVNASKNISIEGGKPDDSEATAVFVINPEAITDSTEIKLTVSDESTLNSSLSLAQAYADGLIDIPEGFEFLKDEFEFVVSEDKPTIKGPTIKPQEGVVEKIDNKGVRWYSGDVDIDFSVEDTTTYLHSIDIQMNGQSIRDKSIDDEGKTIPAYYTVYDAPASAEGNTTTPVTYKHIKIDSSKLGNAGNRISQNQSGNTLDIEAIANNGLSSDANAFYQIDDVAPDITAFSFTDAVDESSREEADVTENKEISEALAEAGVKYDTMTSDNYVYFFQDKTEVTISATDTHSGITGSGVKEIHFYSVGKTSPNGDIKVVDEDERIVSDNFGNMSATFTIPAGFKGSIFAYAVDQVDNKGSQYSPNNLVVENRDIHDSSSDVDITINTKSVATDNNDHPLFNGDVNLTLTVEDLYSGIRSVSYSCIGLESSAVLKGEAFVDGDGDVTDNLGSWDINETDKNLVLNMSRTITLDGFDQFNSNDITIEISGYDCSGYLITKETEVISIDTTKPVIEVSYDPVKGSGNTYGSDEYEYYKESRTMNVTVYERNFDPSGFDYSGILNNYVSGDVPGLSAGANWDTAYSDYSDSSAHSCSFTFANDGDYEITLNCTDEAENKADEYTGEKFTIDTIDPTIEVSLSGNAKNSKYYNETVTATVTVHEHNFAEGETYVTFTPKTDFDTSYDKSSSTPVISSWSGSGDTHTTTIDFSSDGTYSFTFDYKDKALRSAQQFSQSEFVVDKNIDKLIKFIDVEDTTAYDGKIEPKVSFDDTNLDTATSTLTRISLDTTDMQQSSSPASNLKHAMSPASGSSRTDSYENFPEELVNDGIYEFEASGTDLAGNSKTEKILFSVNRFGSTFMLSAQSREWVERGYVNTANQLDVIEINVNEVKDQSVSVTRNSHTESLGSDAYKLSSSGDNENWFRYNYNVYDTNFANDGEYTVTVMSTDTFKKQVNNRTAVSNTEKGIEKTCPIYFVMDTDDPVIQIEGVESDTPYGDPERTVTIICADDNIEAESLVIKNGDEELVNGVDYAMDELAGELDIELIVDEPGKHSLSVYVADKATNNNSDEVTNFELNASIFTLFFHNTVAVICTAVALVALIALIVFLVLRKRKKEDEAKAGVKS